ncbi:hypothetical protein NB600_10305, partial [Vibrio antiquarius]|uniref:hypothetical protein n=1 Tax=Vibrio antiquarius (strain Ex25) TaxID=150340 RepID=UPI00265D3C43
HGLTIDGIKKNIVDSIEKSVEDCLEQSKEKSKSFFEQIHDEDNPIVYEFNKELRRKNKALEDAILSELTKLSKIVDTDRGLPPSLRPVTSKLNSISNMVKEGTYDLTPKYEPSIKTFNPKINFIYKPDNEVLTSWESSVGEDINSLRKFNSWLFQYSFIDIIKLFFIDLLIPITTSFSSLFSSYLSFNCKEFSQDIYSMGGLLFIIYMTLFLSLLIIYFLKKPKIKENDKSGSYIEFE